MTLTNDSLIYNQADGSLGLGSGVYNPGTFTDLEMFIILNHTSTGDNNLGP